MIGAILVGLIVGAIATKIMGAQSNWVLNIILGMAGSFVGRFIFGIIGFHAVSGLAGLIVSVIGACICIAIARKIN
ncbi:MAG: GlsB/YeaQ/YmgE family stress response membrane protein [Oscillospiraceae bacterium]|nr:GlsB/YeaQ/YmgE family stress response membrane protein [Oscillospiraceae bacterium]